MNGTTTPNQMDTSKQIRHVFGCQGTELHITTGTALLQSGDITRCPQCGAAVLDVTNTPIGQAYFAFARPDLGDLPS